MAKRRIKPPRPWAAGATDDGFGNSGRRDGGKTDRQRDRYRDAGQRQQ